MFKRIFIVLVLIAGLETNTMASGIPTFDATTVAQLQQQFTQLKQQYETLKQQYAAITGSYGKGQIGLNDAINAASIVPGSWQEVVAMQKQGAFSSTQNYYEKLINTLPPELFQNPKSQNVTNYKLSTDSVRAAFAGGEALYSEVQTHLKNLQNLGQKIDSTVNVKDAQDLQNRITTENGMLQSSLAKMNALNTNLQANLVNQQNQAQSANEQFYQWK